jgi:hypothetical protein
MTNVSHPTDPTSPTDDGSDTDLGDFSAPQAEVSGATTDELDLMNCRAPQQFQDAETPEIITTVLVDKPSKKDFVRFHPGPDYRFVGAMLIDGSDDGWHLVTRSVAQALLDDIVVVILHLGITQSGRVFITPVQMPGADGHRNPWHESRAKAVAVAETRWVRIIADKNFGGYRVRDANGRLAEPIWPKESFNDLLKLAFRGRVISTLDHPVVRKLQGAVG